MLKETERLERAKNVGRYIVANKATVRQAAQEFGVSKSTIHIDVTKRLCSVDYKLYFEVRKILDYNRSQRTIRGGEATRKKYKK